MNGLNPEKLLERGVRILHETIWDGKLPNRYSVPDLTRVRGVDLNLSAENWCSIAMREGDDYIGGCCGTASAMQDIINGIFRDGGYADAEALYTLGECAKNHKHGFEEWAEPFSQEKFDTLCEKWEELEAWDKILLSWQAVRDQIKPSNTSLNPIVQENRPDLDEEREIDQLYKSFQYLSYRNLFGSLQKDTTGQHHGNEALAFAKIYPGTEKLLAKLEANDTTWSGFAIVEKARPEIIVHNGYGVCVYSQEDDAQQIMELWNRDERMEKSEREQPLPESQLSQRTRIRPVTISVKAGVVFGD